MRKIFAIFLTILLGVALGVGIATLRIGTASWKPTLDQGGQDESPSSPKE